MTRFKSLLFDLDGTLIESHPGILNGVEYALEQFGIVVDDRESLLKFVGPPILESFESFYGLKNEDGKKAVSYFRSYYESKGMFESRLYDGVEEMLKNLSNQGFQLILATSKNESAARLILEKFAIAQYFDFIAGSTPDQSRSKKADVIAFAKKETNFDREQAVMIGDTNFDIIGANENQLESVGVLYGYGTEADLKAVGATYILATVADLEEFLIESK